MASIRKRGSKWQVQIRRDGLPALNRTFIAKDDAVRWAREQDRAVDRGESLPLALCDTRLTFLSDLLDRYVHEVSARKRGSTDGYHLRPVVKALGKLPLTQLRPVHVSTYRQQRLTEVAPATIAKEMSLLCHALKVAADEWGYPIRIEAFRAVRKPSPAAGRTRRLEAGERERLQKALLACRNPLVSSVFAFALATGMRRGEILALRWDHVDWDNRVAFLPLTKNGESRRVPLSSAAIDTLTQLQNARQWTPEGLTGPSCGLVFPLSANAVRLAWERAKKRAGINNLHFHDLRHEAISCFFEMGLSVPEVALISGHKDARMLFRYTQLRAENVAKKLG
jgi:integrase